MNLIVEKLAKESKISANDINVMINEITTSLIKEGCDKDDPRLTQYLIRRLRKRLKIEESITYQSFKQFFSN